jgi:hypothetical protein
MAPTQSVPGEGATRGAPPLSLAARDRYWENPHVVSEIAHRRMLRIGLALPAVLGAALLLSSCAAGANPSVGTGQEPAGFWLGLWHEIIFPVTFVISLFTTT